MSTTLETVEFVLEAIDGAGSITAKKMFGEYGIYLDGKFVALICDDTFFIKPTPAGEAFIGEPEWGAPYPGAKPHFQIDGDKLEDRDWVCELLRLTFDALPAPKPKKPRVKKKSEQ